MCAVAQMTVHSGMTGMLAAGMAEGDRVADMVVGKAADTAVVGMVAEGDNYSPGLSWCRSSYSNQSLPGEFFNEFYAWGV